ETLVGQSPGARPEGFGDEFRRRRRRCGAGTGAGRLLGRSDQPRTRGQGSHLGFFAAFPGDEVLDFGMVQIQAYHLGGPARGASRFDGARGPVENLEKGHETGGNPTAMQGFSRSADGTEIGSGTGTVFENPPFLGEKII